MNTIAEQKPVSIYIPYALLVAALLSAFIMAINKVDLRPGEVEYPAEAFLAPAFDLPTLTGGKIKLSDYRGKVLFINFPSAVHLEPPSGIEAATKQMLKEAAPGDRFIIGITENVPENRWRESFSTILKTVNRFGKLPIQAERL